MQSRHKTSTTKQVTGQWLLDYVCSELNLVEKYYFGLRYTDQHSKRKWLDLKKPVLKQIKDPTRDSIYFRVRYYPAVPELIREEITSYQIYMQLRRDVFHGRLIPHSNDVPLLAALIIQSEFGDYEDVEVDDGFTKDIDLMLKQAAPVEYKVTEAWKELSGSTPAECEAKFIDIVKVSETYGIDPLVVKEKNKGDTFHIGANHAGVLVFLAFRRVRLIKWDSVIKCSLDGKYVSITTSTSPVQEKNPREVLKYKCAEEADAKLLWANILDQQSFFTLHSTEQVKKIKSGGLFSRTSSFRFSGRCYDEVVTTSRKILRMAPDFVRASSTSLNHSLNIRTSRKRLTKTKNRHSIGAIPHSKSMPLTPDAQAGLSDSGINNSESASSNHTLSALDETLERPFKLPAFLEIPPPSSSLEDAPTSQSLKLPVGSGGGSGSSGADEFEDSVDYDELTDSLLASTFLTATPAAQTEACFQSSQLLAVPPNNDISDQLQLSPHVQLDNTSLSLSPPQDEVDSHDTIHDITESDAQTDHKTKSNDNLLKTNGRMPHGAIPSEEQASGLVPGVLEDLCLPGYIVGTTVPPLVDCEPDITYDPLSESTKGELRLYLDQLEETESELGSSVSGRSGRLTPISTPRSLINYFTIFCLITFGVILLLAYILFESSWPSNQLEGLRHSEVVLLVKEVYYNPIRTKLLSLLGYA
ncbi:FRMD5 [Bugula neritina]|uniref:FRMD5 n=1 Tax=Bugula neritina TaxID=10212 RepID=A0A7J7J4D6_BUGNE|nr:FRMD5 [Bugula neritina]